MRRNLLAFALLAAAVLLGGSLRAGADEGTSSSGALFTNQDVYYDEYDDGESHPIRVAAYLIHPVGYALEWIIFRPFHALMSSPHVAEAVGHHPHGPKVVH